MSDPVLRRRIRRLCLVVIALLYLLSVPWYREAGAPLRLWLGLPDWVTVALGCYVVVAFVNGLAWLVTDVEDPPPLPAEEAGGRADSGEASR